MSGASFATRSFQIADGPLGERQVLLGTVVTVADAKALADALAWRRTRDYLAPRVEDADGVVALRAMMALTDELEALASGEHSGPMSLTQAQITLLTETAGAYVTERDTDGYRDPAEAERLTRLRGLGDRLFGLAADFVGAVAEARESGVLR